VSRTFGYAVVTQLGFHL